MTSKYEAALQTVNQLEAAKTAMAYELSKLRDLSEDLTESLAEARFLISQLKDAAQGNARQIEDLQSQNTALIEAAQVWACADPGHLQVRP